MLELIGFSSLDAADCIPSAMSRSFAPSARARVFVWLYGILELADGFAVPGLADSNSD